MKSRWIGNFATVACLFDCWAETRCEMNRFSYNQASSQRCCALNSILMRGNVFFCFYDFTKIDHTLSVSLSLSGDSDIIGKTLRPIHKGHWMAFVTEILEWNLKLCRYQSCKLHSKLNAFVRSVIRELQSYWLKMGGRLQAIHDMFVFVLCVVSVHRLMSSKRKAKQSKNNSKTKQNTRRKSEPREENFP